VSPAVAGVDAIPAATEEGGVETVPAAAGEGGADVIPTAAGPGSADQSDEAAKAEYRKIAERRVRLGLLLAEVGRKNNITVTSDEVNQAITREARRHPGHERQVLDFYRQNPGTIDALRAPIFEDKVIDFIVELAKIGERKVTPQELFAIPEPAGEDTLPS
jgi:trigger factor